MEFVKETNKFHLYANRFLTCQSVPSDKMAAMFSTVEDRLRIPWVSGAVKVRGHREGIYMQLFCFIL